MTFVSAHPKSDPPDEVKLIIAVLTHHYNSLGISLSVNHIRNLRRPHTDRRYGWSNAWDYHFNGSPATYS